MARATSSARRGFGRIERRESGRYRAAYTGPDGGQPVVCLTGSDKAYAEWGADLATALREAGATWIILAGKPVDGVVVDDSCAMGLDALDFLNRTREKLA